jgi:hypothetical protein
MYIDLFFFFGSDILSHSVLAIFKYTLIVISYSHQSASRIPRTYVACLTEPLSALASVSLSQ